MHGRERRREGSQILSLMLRRERARRAQKVTENKLPLIQLAWTDLVLPHFNTALSKSKL